MRRILRKRLGDYFVSRRHVQLILQSRSTAKFTRRTVRGGTSIAVAGVLMFPTCRETSDRMETSKYLLPSRRQFVAIILFVLSTGFWLGTFVGQSAASPARNCHQVFATSPYDVRVLYTRGLNCSASVRAARVIACAGCWKRNSNGDLTPRGGGYSCYVYSRADFHTSYRCTKGPRNIILRASISNLQ